MKNNETPHDYRIKIQSEELELIRNKNIKTMLELCSGDGRNIVYFSELNYEVIGLESNESLFNKSLELIKKQKSSAQVQLHPIFNDILPFNESEFDFVYTYQYINHSFKQNIEEVFKEIYRILKKGGLFSIKVSDIDQFNVKHLEDDIYVEEDPEFLQIKFQKLANQTFTKLEGDEKGIPHYGFTQSELIDSLEKAGFKLINVRKIKWNIVANLLK